MDSKHGMLCRQDLCKLGWQLFQHLTLLRMSSSAYGMKHKNLAEVAFEMVWIAWTLFPQNLAMFPQNEARSEIIQLDGTVGTGSIS